MATFASTVGGQLERPVLKLARAVDPVPESAQPSLLTALQEQLGLKVESTKGPIDYIVIDRLDRPSGN